MKLPSEATWWESRRRKRTLIYQGKTQKAEGNAAMRKDDLELVRSSGNAFKDFGRADAQLEQARAIIAAKIIRILDERELSTRDAEKLTGVAHSEFSRIRNTQLRRFTLDRLLLTFMKLDQDVEVSFTFKARRHARTEPKVA